MPDCDMPPPNKKKKNKVPFVESSLHLAVLQDGNSRAALVGAGGIKVKEKK